MAMNLRRLLLGKPLATHGMEDETLPKYLALPIFSSDALSSVAYATQEMMIALVVAGSAAFAICFWQAFSIVLLLIILTASYNQTIAAYPKGGGAYNVAHDNLGVLPAQVAAVSLMTDYILTVAVSVASGIDAIISALMTLDPAVNNLGTRLLMCLLAVWFIVLMNLRGMKESGRVFAIPVYIFIGSILTLVGLGLWQVYSGGFAHLDTVPARIYHPQVTLGLFLILHSFASGCTALTGLEAISNSTGAFQNPRAKNAQVTMRWLALCLGAMLLGITWLAQKLAAVGHIVASDSGETVISQIAHAIVGNHWFYWCVQIFTFAVLVLAANTSFTGFPRLGAMVATDGFLPRQLMTLGDRLVFTNGIIALGVVASILIVLFRGSTDKLIPLYAIGVYLAFTLSQAGMVQRWRRRKEPGWQIRATMNGIGAFITAVVAVVFGVVKFKDGAWVVLILIPCATYVLHRVGKHYQYVRSKLSLADYRPVEDKRKHVALVPAHDLGQSVLEAVEYAKIISSEVEILQWAPANVDVQPLTIEGAATTLDRSSENWRSAILAQVRRLTGEENALVTVVLAEELPFVGWASLLKGHSDLVIKFALLNQSGVVVADTRRYRIASGIPEQPSKGRGRVPHTALVLVPSLHRGTMEGLAYARRISTRSIQALNIEVDPVHTEALRKKWEQWTPDLSLLVVESPYREIRTPLISYIRALRVHKPGCIITVVVPEFVARKWWNKLLHNHAGFLLKLALRNESGIVLANPRYFLHEETSDSSQTPTLVAQGT